MRVSVIISTYNHPEWLEKVLHGFRFQTWRDFELVIADDGSGPETRSVIDRFRSESGIHVIHSWQEDDGFQKSRILNKAITDSTTGYLIFTDGDCIPRNDFVEVHVRAAEPGRFLSGGYFMLPMETSKAISLLDIEHGNAFDVQWLVKHGLKPSFKTLKLTSHGWRRDFLNFITPTRPTWNGHNASGWKKDLLAVNGFNEEMKYGGQDRELGERLVNLGIRGKQIRYSAVCVHLDHKRGYKTAASINFNRAIRSETRKTGRTRTSAGIVKE
ncbi:MAG: glycosyltransferase family 2 protein [Bacteroidota bacterium]